jgi:hypothetical protein
LNWILVVLLSHLAGPPDRATLVKGFAPGPEISNEYVLASYLETSRRNQVRGASMVTEFEAVLPKLDRSATLQARRIVNARGEVNYEVLQSAGDSAVKKEVIARYIAAEMEPPAHLPTDVAITPANYKFKPKGVRERDGVTCFVYEVSPRKKRVGLFKGEVWVDVETGLTVREAGTFSKSPSVFLKSVQFSRDFHLRDGYSVPWRFETSMVTRFWGPARLTINYNSFGWDSMLASAPVAGNGPSQE